MRFISLLLLLVMLCCDKQQPQASRAQATAMTPAIDNIPDKRISVEHYSGNFVGFGIADHIFAGIKNKNSEKPKWFSLNPTLKVEFFLAQFQNKPVSVTYEIVETTYIVGDGERTRGRVERLLDAKCGAQNYTDWWAGQIKSQTEEQLEQKFAPMVDKAEIIQ